MSSINFDCKNCIHFPVCVLRPEAAEQIEAFNANVSKSESFEVSLNCKYYGNKNHNLLCK